MRYNFPFFEFEINYCCLANVIRNMLIGAETWKRGSILFNYGVMIVSVAQLNYKLLI